MSDIHFRLMALGFMFQDLVNPPENILKEVIIKPGDRVLDFGCGPGSYSLAAARLVHLKNLSHPLRVIDIRLKPSDN